MKDILATLCPPPTSSGPLKPAQIDLIYYTYRDNRESGVTAAELAKIWPQTGAEMEQRYWDEISAYAAKMVSLDKEARHTGGPEHDRDLAGRKLRAGS